MTFAGRGAGLCYPAPMTRINSYEDGFARYYDLLIHRARDVAPEPEELLFLQWAFRRGARRTLREVLDAGCGTGRHVLALARMGYRVTGMDLSAGMVRECRRRLREQGLAEAARAVTGDLTALRRPRAFDAVLCMDSSFDYLSDAAAGRKALVGLRESLRPGGMLILDSWDYRREWKELREPEKTTHVIDGVCVEYEDRHTLDAEARVFRIHIRATVHEGRRPRVVEIRHQLRLTSAKERKRMLREAGFADVLHYSDFSSRKPLAGGRYCRILCTALRPEDD